MFSKIFANLAFLITLLLLVQTSQAGIGCLSPSGKPVDWFVVLKAPKQIDPTGLSYDYLDSTNYKKFVQYTNINSEESPVYQTLSQIKNLSNSSLIQFAWNDEEANGTTHSTQAHAKGVIGGDCSSVFVLEHSVPRFPDTSSGQINVKLPSTGLMYGQHFFCVSMDIKNLQYYSNALQIIRPFVFSWSKLPSSLDDTLPNLEYLKNNSKFTDVLQLIQPIKSLNGTNFTKFAKNKKQVVQLYANIVAPYYRVGMEFETWVNGGGGLQGPYCGQYDVFTVSEVSLTMGKFSTKYDHSKYGVSLTGNISCFADLNRFDSQDKRGGGSFCFQNTQLSQLIRGNFQTSQKCASASKVTLLEEKLRALKLQFS